MRCRCCRRVLILGLVWIAAAWGCRMAAPEEKEVPAAHQNLRFISAAYFRATIKLDRPPRTLEELRPFLKEQTESADVLRSPNDGENYVILWGVDVRKPPAEGKGTPIWAYEQRGKDGTRYVLRGKNVAQLTDEEFQRADFPRGHKPVP